MRMASARSHEAGTAAAIIAAHAELTTKLGGKPDWLLVHAAVRHDPELIRTTLVELGAHTIHGASSCLGIMTETGADIDGGLGLLGIRDAAGGYGVAMAPLGEDPGEAAASALRRAIQSAGRDGELPALVWISAAPGHEERCLAGIERVIGAGVPIVGGSAADDAVAGAWYLLTDAASEGAAIVVSVLYPSTPVHSAFGSGYAASERRGRVSAAEGRTILAIDGEPAARVYDAWTGGAIAAALHEGGSVLASTTLFPLARRVGSAQGVDYHRLAHPESVTPSGGLRLFADVEVGDELIAMKGTAAALRERAGRVADDALTRARRPSDAIAGALVIFCAGCMLTVRDELDEVVAGLRRSLGSAPFLGAFTFGEQGCFLGGENRHGNLMISVTIFERP